MDKGRTKTQSRDLHLTHSAESSETSQHTHGPWRKSSQRESVITTNNTKAQR